MSQYLHPSTQKTRHYAHLASRLKSLQTELSQTEEYMEVMAKQLDSMAKLGVYCGSQFMAASRLLDVDLEKQTQANQGNEDTRT